MVQGYWAYMENNFHERMEQFLSKIVTVNALMLGKYFISIFVKM